MILYKNLAYVTMFYGIGQTTGKKLLGLVGLANQGNPENIEEYSHKLEEILELMLVGQSARRKLLEYVLYLKRIKSYRGLRGAAGLPIRGQRTHTNANTFKSQIQRFNYLDLEIIRKHQLMDIKPIKRSFGPNKRKQKRHGPSKKQKMYNTNLYKNKSFAKKDRINRKKQKKGKK